MGFLRYTFLKMLSEDSLRRKSDRIQRKLDRLDYDSKKYLKLSNKSIDYVNAIASKCAGKMPKREHGWYISKDD